MNRQFMLTIGVAVTFLLTGADCEGNRTNTESGKHTLPEQPIPNPDPNPPQVTGNPPRGISVTFTVNAAKAIGKTIVTYTIGDRRETFTIKISKNWGTIVTLGTGVSLIAAPASPGTPGRISIQIRRDPGGLVCGDENGLDDYAVGGAGCAGIV